MNFFSFRKNRLLNKRLISCLLILSCVFSMFAMKIANADEDLSKEIRILEIQPGDFFEIDGNESGIHTRKVNDYKAVIEHVSMPEFIGKKDQLNGKYDIIVIGSSYNEKSNYGKDRRYSGIINTGTEINGTIVSDDNTMYPNGNYVENDITKRKAEEILSFINSGQLVYIDTNIFSIENSSLKEYFENISMDNLIKYNSSKEIELVKIVKRYLKEIQADSKNGQKSVINMRPRISAECSDGDSTSDDYGDLNKRNMIFRLNIPESSKRYTVKLYLDIDGDGVFSEKECYEKKTNVLSQNNYIITHNIGTQFIGWLEWKIEIEENNIGSNDNVKSYVTGNILFRKLKDQPKKVIKVLQVYPDFGTDGLKGLDLKNNEKFQELTKLDDYEIVIDMMSSEEFNESAGDTLKLNGNYSMIMIGFYDNYNLRDIKNQKALDELQNFIATGQSVMFTHDTMGLRMETPDKASVELTKRFRDFVGQSRFVDKFKENKTESDDKYIYTIDSYKEYNKSTGLYEERKIPHINLHENNGNIAGYAVSGRKNLAITKKVYLTNSGLINSYPYELGETIEVARTHSQYYQLNLEDPDVIPLYNLSSDNDAELNKYDSRNNYYTYCKGNITYSGTGHLNEYTEDEFKLFVNTIIKAERGANHAPIINCSIPIEKSEGVNEVNCSQNYYFSVNARDYENDIVDMNITINGEELSYDNFMSEINLTTDDEGREIFSIKTGDFEREDVRIKIPSEKFKNAISNNETVNIVIRAVDMQGAESYKYYELLPIKSEAEIDVQFVSATPATANNGDVINVKYSVSPQDYYYNSNMDDGSMIDEAIFLVDLSKDMNNNEGNRFPQVKSTITTVINDLDLKENTRFGIVGFNEKSYVGNRIDENDPKSCVYTETNGQLGVGLIKPLYSLTDGNEWDGYRQLYQEDKYLYSKLSNSEERNLDYALRDADEIFNRFGEKDKKRAIIIISSGDLIFTDSQLSIIRDKGYRIITIDMSGRHDTNIRYAHSVLSGNESGERYMIVSKSDGGQYNFTKEDMEKVVKYLKGASPTKKEMNVNGRFKFNLGEYFVPCHDSPLVNIDDNKYLLDVSDMINYVKTDEEDASGKTKYIAEEFEVNFQVRINSLNKGNFGFNTQEFTDEQYINEQLINGTHINNDSCFEYRTTDDSDYTSLSIKTPVIKIKKNYISIEHGIYNGFIQNKPDINTAVQSFSGGTNITFGAYIQGIENNKKVTLNIDNEIAEYDVLDIWYIDSEGKNIIKGNASGFVKENEGLSYTVSDMPSGYSRMLILYNEKLPYYQDSVKHYINNIKVDDGQWFPAEMIVSKPDMPELF